MSRKKPEEMTEEEKKEQAELLAEREADKQRLKDEYESKAKAQQDALIKATEARAKAETLLQTMQSMANTQQPPKEWTPEQWKDFEEKTGLTKDQLMIVDNIAKSHIDLARNEFSEKAKKAEDRAAQAEERVKVYEKDKSYDGFKKDYFSKNPAYGRYEKDFDEFIGAFPAEIKNDPAKLTDIFSKAALYVKGKVGEKNMRTTGGGVRFDAGGDEEESKDVEADLRGLRPYEKLLVGGLVPSKDDMDRLGKYQHDLKGDNGVMISGKEEWDKYKKK